MMITISSTSDPAELARRAALIGPGYRGRRRSGDDEERESLRAAFVEFGMTPPAYLDRTSDWVERRAKLFETGDFPDKGVTITPTMLKSLERNFDMPVPVLIEHSESSLELGYLVDVEVTEGELFGTVALTPEANALVDRSGAHSLSLGLNAELTEIREVSLVRNPRITDARLFFAGSLEQGWRARFEALEAQRLFEAAELKVAGWIREGRLTPAQSRFALALMATSQTVEFDGASCPIGMLVAGLVESRSPSSFFGELAAAPQPSTPPLMLPEEAEFYRRYFPDVSLDQIAAKR